MTNLVVVARELVILLDGVVNLERIIASQESHVLPVFLAFYHLVVKPFAAHESTVYDAPPASFLGL